MSFYSDRIFPWIIDKVMSNRVMTEQRREVLAAARGRTLEIGFGTGLNLPHYPPGVEHLTLLDPNGGMHRRAADRLAAAKFPTTPIVLSAEGSLPVADDAFDTVVSTWTMCSIPNLSNALTEIARVLKPDGVLLFIEHGLAPEAKVQRWQHRLTPFMKRLGDGCHLNRNIEALLSASPLKIIHCDQFFLPDTPRFAGWTYRGHAAKKTQPNTA